MKVLIGTKNPGKIEGAKRAFGLYFNNIEIEGISSPSDVAEQPVDLDIYKGAENRVKNLIKIAKDGGENADFYVAIESGMTNRLGKWVIINIAVIEDNNGNVSWGTSAGFPIPDKFVDQIKDKSLATVMDEIFNEKDLRSSTGGIGVLTSDRITRIDLNYQAFVMALTQFINNKWNNFN